MHTGEAKTPGGRAGEGTTDGHQRRARPARLSRRSASRPARRCRLNGRTIDFAQCELQPGDDDPQPFSFLTDERSTHRRTDSLLDHVHQRRGPRADSREPAPRADVQRADPIARAALLPVDRGQGRALRRQGRATSSFWSPRAATRTKSTSTASRPACRATCRTRCCG